MAEGVEGTIFAATFLPSTHTLTHPALVAGFEVSRCLILVVHQYLGFVVNSERCFELLGLQDNSLASILMEIILPIIVFGGFRKATWVFRQTQPRKGGKAFFMVGDLPSLL
jgi:hypothetical protein